MGSDMLSLDVLRGLGRVEEMMDALIETVDGHPGRDAIVAEVRNTLTAIEERARQALDFETFALEAVREIAEKYGLIMMRMNEWVSSVRL